MAKINDNTQHGKPVEEEVQFDEDSGHHGRGQRGDAPEFDPMDWGMAIPGSGIEEGEMLEFTKTLALTADQSSKQMASSLGAPVDLKIITIMSSDIACPMVVLVNMEGGRKCCYVYLIEAMLSTTLAPEIIPPRAGTMNREVIIDMPTMRVFDAAAIEVVTEYVMAETKCAEHEVDIRGWCVTKSTPTWSSKGVAGNYFSFGSHAVLDPLRSKANRIGLRNLVHKGMTLKNTIRLTPGKSDHMSLTGEALRGDFVCTLELSTKRDSSRRREVTMVNDRNRSRHLVTTTGYVDFAPISAVGATHSRGQQAGQTQPGHIPVLALTQVTGQSKARHRDSEDINTPLLGLWSLAPLIYRRGWAAVFKTTPGSEYVAGDLGLLACSHDPWGVGGSALGRANVDASPMAVDSDDTFTVSTMANLWTTEGVVIALDIERGGPIYNLQVFEKAANGDTDANGLIIAAADGLTGNRFSRMWADVNSDNPDAMVMREQTTQIHLGNCVSSKNSGLADIRALDHLTVAETDPSDPQWIRSVCAGTHPGADSNAVMDRRNAIEKVLNNPVITGLAVRVFYRALFINTFYAAMDKARVRAEIISPIVDNNVSNNGMDADMVTGLGGSNPFASNASAGGAEMIGSASQWQPIYRR